MKKAGVALDRKVLADLALFEPGDFAAVVKAGSGLGGGRHGRSAATARGAREERGREIPAAADAKALDALRVRFLGKKGELSAALRGMGQLDAEERPRVGEAANRVRDAVEALLSQARLRHDASALEAELRGPPVDVTLPGRELLRRGRRHPVTRASDDITDIFARLGYEVATGPEIELDWYNFEALNIPADHPARDMQDTFYVGRGHPRQPRRRRRSGAAHPHLAGADPQPCCAPASRPSASSAPGASTGRTTTRPTPRCSTRWRDCASTGASPSPT